MIFDDFYAGESDHEDDEPVKAAEEEVAPKPIQEATQGKSLVTSMTVCMEVDFLWSCGGMEWFGRR